MTRIPLCALVASRFGRVAPLDRSSWLIMAIAWLTLWRNLGLHVIVGIGVIVSLVIC